MIFKIYILGNFTKIFSVYVSVFSLSSAFSENQERVFAPTVVIYFYLSLYLYVFKFLIFEFINNILYDYFALCILLYTSKRNWNPRKLEMAHLCWKVIFTVFIYTKEVNVAYACSLFVIDNVFRH